MADLFGARMGYKLIRFFRDFEMHSLLAEKNIGKFADFMGGSGALKIDKFGEGMERITTLRRQMTSIFMDELLRGPGGSDFSNSIFDALDPEKLRPKIQALVSSLGRNLEVLMGGSLEGASFGDIFKNIGKQFGEGFKESLNMNPLIPIFGKGLFGGDNKSTSQVFDPENKRHTSLLERIEQNVGRAKFA
jgi:hypothetical protein